MQLWMQELTLISKFAHPLEEVFAYVLLFTVEFPYLHDTMRICAVAAIGAIASYIMRAHFSLD